MAKDTKLPEEEVNVKISFCHKCGQDVRVAVEHMMDKKSIREFGSEVVKHNLGVKTVSLLEWRKNNSKKFCTCK